EKKKLGNLGEKLAQKNLLKKRYDILELNFFSQFGEIDIIATKGNEIIFVEVKTRTSNIESALSSVSFSKQQKLHKTAQIFLSKNPKYSEYFTRFDVIAVVKNNNHYQIEHLEDAFRIY
ncbi:MAG: YraN family protein, partial [Candidatus Cloacimonadota bacterium]|nr:YraN family protein [Candidatus Cloacimonadota bacterium]